MSKDQESETVTLSLHALRQLQYNHVVMSLMLQGSKAMVIELDQCAYRTKDDCRCGIGWMIPDHVYNPNMETRRISALLTKYENMKSIFGSDINFLKIIQQQLHDDIPKLHDNIVATKAYNTIDFLNRLRKSAESFASVWGLEPLPDWLWDQTIVNWRK